MVKLVKRVLGGDDKKMMISNLERRTNGNRVDCKDEVVCYDHPLNGLRNDHYFSSWTKNI
ncbi:hypothetical protein MJO28_015322 [Puccinia striiformis f. sp. tritici]|uniref:Uncharacterized protein n=1 Tax=Puccinia striiformis f. sp. tritici TaxID=168172 RepID=A0ACC0DSM0_9BASI|nr:hypothetical protein MJO28_015322 [Puccinia striiformis f. sp. tritici]